MVSSATVKCRTGHGANPTAVAVASVATSTIDASIRGIALQDCTSVVRVERFDAKPIDESRPTTHSLGGEPTEQRGGIDGAAWHSGTRADDAFVVPIDRGGRQQRVAIEFQHAAPLERQIGRVCLDPREKIEFAAIEVWRRADHRVTDDDAARAARRTMTECPID